jgi:hypothetical protein
MLTRFVFLGSLVVIAVDLPGQSQPTPQPAAAQAAQPPRIPRATASTRASVTVLIDSRWGEGGWFGALNLAGPAKIAIDYGQPHARGRNVVGLPGVMPWDTVWRAGANMSTQLTAEVDMTIGNTFIPRGIYTLFALPARNGWKLIVSKELLEWGTDYDPKQDFARIDLRSRTLPEPIESLTFWLIPALEAPPSTTFPHGVLKFAWGNTELSTDWRVGR